MVTWLKSPKGNQLEVRVQCFHVKCMWYVSAARGVLHHSRHLWVVLDEYLITTEAGSLWVYELETPKLT